ncbi:MAG: hypothetical protein ACOCWG_04545 [bacterium]
MNYKKILLVLFLSIFISGCGLTQSKDKVPMDKLGSDNLYNYQNESLEFGLDLPPEFEYYQTQRKRAQNGDYTDIEFFVPTNDEKADTEIPSYAKVIVVRVFPESGWDNVDKENSIYKKVGEGNGNVYAIKFWQEAPKDWQDKWSREMQERILQSFYVN